jgi:hypothetical protein
MVEQGDGRAPKMRASSCPMSKSSSTPVPVAEQTTQLVEHETGEAHRIIEQPLSSVMLKSAPVAALTGLLHCTSQSAISVIAEF